MKFIADFHIHSHFSLATSKQLSPEYLDYWAKIKGIQVVGTGDFQHPKWFDEMHEKLEAAEPGLFKLKKDFVLENHYAENTDVRFLLTTEISSIYKKNGKVRKVHNVIFAPDFETVEKIQQKFRNYNFNISSDGRPIIGMDCKDLLDMCLNVSDKIFFVPAHVWTPWFSVLGDKSGFNSVEECFEELTDHIYAIETGLSTDPALNWMCSILDRFTLLSNSDAHSPDKLGRNANFFDTELNYFSILEAIKKADPNKFLGTIDYFPQEGKYHYDGHRKCNIVWNPVETLKHNGKCPVCGKKVVIGVVNRIAELADRADLSLRPNRLPFFSLIPLKEILCEITGMGENSKAVDQAYHSIIKRAGSEFNVLLHSSVDEVKHVAGEVVAEAIKRMREGKVYIKEGFDGEYGVIKVFRPGEVKYFGSKKSLFDSELTPSNETAPERKLMNFDLDEYKRLKVTHKIIEDTNEPEEDRKTISALNKEQTESVKHFTNPAMVIAGPGTGKTKVLTERIVHLINNKNIAPEKILAITFTNKAAGEMRKRLSNNLPTDIGEKINVSTFHAFGLQIITENIHKIRNKSHFNLADENEKKIILTEAGIKKNEQNTIIKEISLKKQLIDYDKERLKDELFILYQQYLEKYNLFDFDDLLYIPVNLFESNKNILTEYQSKYEFVLIDEYQDINPVQFELIRKLLPDEQANLFVIGDPNQSIYSFRGSDISFIQSFKDFYNPTIFQLNKSYRCTDLILKASHNIIRSIETEKNLLKGLSKGVKIKLVPNISDKAEAEFIARTIEEQIGGLRFFSIDTKISDGEKSNDIESLSDFAILCRSHAQMAVIEQSLKNHAVPYQIAGEESFYKQEPIASILDVAFYIFDPENLFYKTKLNLKNIKQETIENIKEKASTDIILLIIEKYFSDIKENYPNELNKLISLSKEQPVLKDFLNSTKLSTSADTHLNSVEAVHLMTIHASKGLEFKCVFIAGCEEGILPYNLYNKQNINTEEEQRLLYVGMTRAEKHLYLTYAAKRNIGGKELQLPRSNFLDKLEKQLFEIQKIELKQKTTDKQLSLF